MRTCFRTLHFGILNVKKWIHTIWKHGFLYIRILPIGLIPKVAASKHDDIYYVSLKITKIY